MKKSALCVPFLFLAVSCGSLDSNDSTVKQEQKGPTYLALGDSIAFGYSPLVDYTEESVQGGLFVGYPEVVASKAHFNLTNVACTGETTGSFIDKTAKDNGCYSGDAPMHDHLKVNYDVSQLDFALDFLNKNPDTKLITLTLGGNDILLVEDECNLQAVPFLCKASKLASTAITIGKNLGSIIDSIHKTGYKGQIIFLTQYARNFKDPIQTLALGTIQTEVRLIAHLKKFDVASGYDAFNKAAAAFDGDTCKAGLIILKEDGTCNQHPSAKGREILGQAVLDLLK